MQQLNLEEYLQELRDGSEGKLEPSPNRKRPGKFMVSAALVEHEVWPEVLEKLVFTPVRIEMLWRSGPSPHFEYVGFSPYFRELEQSEFTPEYAINIQTDDSGSVDEVIAVEFIQ